MKGISLFAGAGGMDVGFSKAGVSIFWANEFDKDAVNTYRLNNIDTQINDQDIKIAKNELLSISKKSIDIVFGGPPCQGFSVAGKMNPNDERNKLVLEFLDVVKLIKPAMFVMENVKALGQLDRWKETRQLILETSRNLGYNTFYKVLNSAYFGVPQKRERVFFIGYLNANYNVERIFIDELKKQEISKINLRECLLKLPFAGTKENPITCTAKITLALNPVLRKSPYAGMLFNGLGRPLDLDNQSNTLPASMGGNKTPILDELLLHNPKAENWLFKYHSSLFNGTKNHNFTRVPDSFRRLTTLEAAAIQTFPVDYKFSGEKSSIYRQIGNAVPCNLAKAVASATISSLNKLDFQKV